jgi:hypothetical protein
MGKLHFLIITSHYGTKRNAHTTWKSRPVGLMAPTRNGGCYKYKLWSVTVIKANCLFTMERNQLSCARCNIFLARVQDDPVHQLLSSPRLPHSHNPTRPSAAILFRAGSSRCLVPPTSSPLIATHMTTCPGPVLKCS